MNDLKSCFNWHNNCQLIILQKIQVNYNSLSELLVNIAEIY